MKQANPVESLCMKHWMKSALLTNGLTNTFEAVNF